jgi:hypothetical protein
MTGRLLLRHPWQLWQRDRIQYPYYQQYLVEVVGTDLFKLGGMVEQFQQKLLAGITGNGQQ